MIVLLNYKVFMSELASHQEEHTDPFGVSLEGRFLFWIAVAFSIFQIATAAHVLDLPSQVVRAVHLGFLLLLTYPLLSMKKHAVIKVLAWALALASAGVAVYQWLNYSDLLIRAGDLSELDFWVGLFALSAVFVAAWVLMGPALPIISGCFLAYCLFGQYLPAPLNHRGYGVAQVVERMAYGTEGIYGVPIYVSSSYIFLFVLFGAFLEKAGMIKWFTDISLAFVGHAQGGAAKVAVVSSALMGTVSGSGVANVVTTGQFTIPLMKRFGYRAAFAGGVEATASMGGQLMPPVMGAVAFIMAESLGVEYADIVQAAIIPAVLYYFGAFWMVHLEAGKHGLLGLDKAQLPSAKHAFVSQWYLVIPLIALMGLLAVGYTPLFAGTVGLVFTVVLILGASVALGLPSLWLRVLFWMGLGVICAAFLQFGVWVICAVVACLVAWNAFSQGGRITLKACVDSLADGAKSALGVGVACGIVGIVIGTVTLTGAANTFGQYVVGVGQNSLFLSLLLTMITCLVLGMGIPTLPNYIITSSIAGPALEQLGVPLIISHMFVFYFGILADLTPPVALACFAAAPIAKARGLSISLEAVKIAVAGFVVPFMAVYSPELMLQSGEQYTMFGYVLAVFYGVLKALLAVALWGSSVIGYLGVVLPMWLRVMGMSASLLLIAAIPVTDEMGFLLATLFGIFVMKRRRRAGLDVQYEQP